MCPSHTLLIAGGWVFALMAQTPHPVPAPPQRPLVGQQEQAFQSQASDAWRSARALDLQNRPLDALEEYRSAAAFLERARQQADYDQIPMESRPAGFYLGVAECHINIVRILVVSGRKAEVIADLGTAERSLLLLQNKYRRSVNPKALPWAWRMFYVLGDLHLLQGNTFAARDDYARSAELNPQFAPASALVEYLPHATPTRTPVATSPPTPSQYPLPSPTSDRLSKELQRKVPPELIATGVGLTLELAAEILGIVELGPIGLAISTGAFLWEVWDYAHSPKGRRF
jgi:hypothetical protein